MPHDDVENIGSNRSTATHIDEVVAARYSRRAVVTGGTAAAAFTFFVGTEASSATAVPGTQRGDGPLIDFTPLATSSADSLIVPPEYTAQVLIPWGTPLVAGIEWAKDASSTSAEQEQQVGFPHDGIHFFPLGKGKGLGSRWPDDRAYQQVFERSPYAEACEGLDTPGRDRTTQVGPAWARPCC